MLTFIITKIIGIKITSNIVIRYKYIILCNLTFIQKFIIKLTVHPHLRHCHQQEQIQIRLCHPRRRRLQQFFVNIDDKIIHNNIAIIKTDKISNSIVHYFRVTVPRFKTITQVENSIIKLESTESICNTASHDFTNATTYSTWITSRVSATAKSQTQSTTATWIQSIYPVYIKIEILPPHQSKSAMWVLPTHVTSTSSQVSATSPSEIRSTISTRTSTEVILTSLPRAIQSRHPASTANGHLAPQHSYTSYGETAADCTSPRLQSVVGLDKGYDLQAFLY